jgi:hypothetical protein
MMSDDADVVDWSNDEICAMPSIGTNAYSKYAITLSYSRGITRRTYRLNGGVQEVIRAGLES